ncbi:MAG: tetraacyldisaccharide 4'-kinase [Zoogloeaceae bacterium]|jgi:tetraacyldisaccharide 4'-kinase|nr:tetraacyldisaccharide 4'-kinase [Zoogloeaceae bacterium]
MMAVLTVPLSWLFALIAALRRAFYRVGIFAAVRLPVPVIVVGNITVGGAGKTPLTIWLAEELRKRGRHAGVISRGYGGSATGTREVGPDDDPAVTGDEPLLIRRRTGCPVFVGRDRVAAGRALLAAHPETDVLLCDDGLQHYRLGRDVEIAVVDRRGFQNGLMLPAGPLREPVSRLRTVDAVVAHDWNGAADFRMTLVGERFKPLAKTGESALSAEFAGKRIHAVAGIGEPQRFFDHLAALGLRFEAHPFPDHHVYAAADLDFTGDVILTTEKDAVKFGVLARLPVWVLPVAATVTPDLAQFVLERINGRPSA